MMTVSKQSLPLSKLFHENEFKKWNTASFGRLYESIHSSEPNKIIQDHFKLFWNEIFLVMIPESVACHPEHHVVSCGVSGVITRLVNKCRSAVTHGPGYYQLRMQCGVQNPLDEIDADVETSFGLEMLTHSLPLFLDILQRHGQVLESFIVSK